MNSAGTVSIIVSTYNSPRYLARALRSLQQQSDQNYEVVVADDGSGEETAELIQACAAESSARIAHAWHEDQGFRAAAARNNAVRLAEGDYLVFLDGDCIARPDFVCAHREFAETGYFVRGSRIMLREQLTRKIFDGEDLPAHFPAWLLHRMKGEVKRVGSLLPLPYTAYRKSHDWDGVKTCNLGIWRSDFEAVNGFDERYIGWGHEDADLAVRLLRYGVLRKEGRASIPVIHLWHEENDRGQLSANTERLQKVIAASHHVANPGLKAISE